MIVFCFISQGVLPTENNTIVSQPVCVQTYSLDCEFSWNIDIKRCPGNVLLYNLVTSPKEKSGYCFGKNLYIFISQQQIYTDKEEHKI